MPKLLEKMLLYHGSYCEVSSPDLSKCAKYKDFGQGFYLTSSEEQARNFAKISVRKAIDNGLIVQQDFGFVSVFTCSDPSCLHIKDYPIANVDWVHCIVGHRRSRTFSDLVEQLIGYDVISGKIANDNTNATIAAYMRGVFGEVGTEIADRVCISLLLPDRLQDQYCFRTEKALSTLTFEWSDRVCL